MDAGFILALQFCHRDLEPDCVGVSTKGGGGVGAKYKARGVTKRRTRGGEMLPKLAVSWQVSKLRSEEAGCFREVAGVSIIAAGDLRSQ